MSKDLLNIIIVSKLDIDILSKSQYLWMKNVPV